MTAPATQQAITAAVTPVVMISANAILIGAISSKHQSMSDRVRALTSEWRSESTGAQRKENIARQVRLFNQRLRWVTWSHITLYAATGCFIALVIDLAATTTVETWTGHSVALLVLGVALMFSGIVLELLDLAQARRTSRMELEDVLGYTRNRSSIST